MKQEALRILDVNFNRAKEGLRVTEDICRFIIQNDALRKKTRQIRHALDCLTKEKVFDSAIINRDANKDLGKAVDALESKRSCWRQILYTNLGRSKESLRVLEEFSKIFEIKTTKKFKDLRYKLYQLEQELYLTTKK